MPQITISPVDEGSEQLKNFDIYEDSGKQIDVTKLSKYLNPQVNIEMVEKKKKRNYIFQL
jgi:hypothetical protein